ncbi:MAG: Ger(x)C family spore germination protein [Halanaerobiales bacterium]|nr:Ger(x)C family spore germination protein [Halanaerobiales bacterium]
MSKQSIIMVIIVVLFCFTTGCWNRSELNEKAIVSGYGVDLGEEKDEIRLTAQIILAEAMSAGGESGEKETVGIVSGTGNTIFNIDRDLLRETGRKLFDSHSHVIIIGEDAAKQGIDRFLDFFTREHEIRRRNWVLVAKGTAKEVLEAKLKFEKIPTFGISNLINAGNITSKTVAVDLKSFLEMISSKTISPFATGIEVIEGDNGEKGLRLTDTGVFKDYKLQGWLDEKETRGLLWVIGKVGSGIIEVKVPKKEGKYISIEILKASSKVKPEIKNGFLTISIEVVQSGRIGEQPPGTGLENIDGVKIIEKVVENNIKDEIQSVLKKAQMLNTDIFGFGETVYRKYPKEWRTLEKNWDGIFPNINVNVNVESTIINPGIIVKPASPE